AAVFSYWRTTVAGFKETNDKIDTLWAEWPKGNTALTLMAREDPRETHLLKRGDWLKPTTSVTPGFPAFLHSFNGVRKGENSKLQNEGGLIAAALSPKGGEGDSARAEAKSGRTSSIGFVADEDAAAGTPPRLMLANWLVDKRSPTTARVLVNRLWQAYFGVGIVNTPEDFGMQSEAPSHAELLDWLACEFMEPAIKGEIRTANSEVERSGFARPWSLRH